MNSPFLLLLLKENNRTCEKPRQEEMLSWCGALGLAQAFCCVSAESSQAATPHSGLRLPKLPLHLNRKPVLLQIEMGIHEPEVCQGSKGPRLWLPLIDPMEQLEDLPPSWGLSGIHSCKLQLHPSPRLGEYLGYPSCLTACFSWTYATFITLQPCVSLSGLPETGWQVQKLLGWHKHTGVIGWDWGSFCKKTTRMLVIVSRIRAEIPSSETT